MVQILWESEREHFVLINYYEIDVLWLRKVYDC